MLLPGSLSETRRSPAHCCELILNRRCLTSGSVLVQKPWYGPWQLGWADLSHGELMSWRYKKGGENIKPYSDKPASSRIWNRRDIENKPQASTTLESMITYRFQWLWVSVRSPSIWIVYLFIKTLLLLLPNSTDFAPETHHFGCSKYIPDHEPLNFCGTPAVYNVTPVASHLAARFMRGNNGEKQHNLSKWIIHIILHPLTWKIEASLG